MEGARRDQSTEEFGVPTDINGVWRPMKGLYEKAMRIRRAEAKKTKQERALGAHQTSTPLEQRLDPNNFGGYRENIPATPLVDSPAHSADIQQRLEAYSTTSSGRTDGDTMAVDETAQWMLQDPILESDLAGDTGIPAGLSNDLSNWNAWSEMLNVGDGAIPSPMIQGSGMVGAPTDGKIEFGTGPGVPSWW
jgi:hypothetical protein